jgi:hypothetical protein
VKNKSYAEWRDHLGEWAAKLENAGIVYHGFVYRQLYNAALRCTGYQQLKEALSGASATLLELVAAVTPFGERVLEEVGIKLNDIEKHLISISIRGYYDGYNI